METEKETILDKAEEKIEEGSETQTKLVWTRIENTNEPNTRFKIKRKLLKKLFSCFFIQDSTAWDLSGICPCFERDVLFDKCKNFTFTFSRLFWERVFNETRPLNSSIRAKRLNRPKEEW
ncbi:hypothetical protein WEN_00970 [Mycoplasma wenyonii str. Massachusetts]|uniref:Uncharacterized protein n=1 Tax=Mycoplasma wenyonii (strain Massachusetts) TaxID=1197325 RepID=I6ZII7_MYCWM|nr:hypothetical protein [Mycoplasma wenyonii]AFN64995.1 hypothetical protein WEN_00970 [Mycoplasma wenyonii str. Massachusetts]